MTARTPMQVTNRLIDGLPRRDRESILTIAEPIDLVFGAVLCEPDTPLRHVYFPLTGFISLMQTVSDNPPLEMGMVGNEGMLGATLALGVYTAPLRAVVQGDGSSLQMTAAQLLRVLRESPALKRELKRYLFVLLAQASQNAACTRFHAVEARLARWLLMTHDRAHADHFRLTHMFLADMLGVRRSAVTIAAGSLQAKKLISYARGNIKVLARAGLEAAACECYAAVVDDYASQFPVLSAHTGRASVEIASAQ